MKPKVLYLGVGNPCSPASGIDMVVREHIFELLKIDQIELRGVVVGAYSTGKTWDLETLCLPGFKFLCGNRNDVNSRFNRIMDKIFFILSGRLLVSYSYGSKAASEYIANELLERPDLVIVDHMMTFCNVSMKRLKKYTPNVIFIAHNVTFHSILDGGRLKEKLLKKLYFLLQAIQSWILEIYLISSCKRVAFLSEWDRRYFGWVGSTRAVSLCPVLRFSNRQKTAGEMKNSRLKTFVFIGSPLFVPNKFAIEWILNSLAPEVLKLDRDVSIKLVGKETEKHVRKGYPNVVGLGFMDEQDLENLLDECVAILSPIDHGSGVKIKVLEGFAAGCPILATEKSLRGFEFMQLEQKIDIKNPRKAAEELVALANDQQRQNEVRAEIRERWNQHVKRRAGALERIVCEVIGPRRD